jgi:hypothetical protein
MMIMAMMIMMFMALMDMLLMTASTGAIFFIGRVTIAVTTLWS